MPEKHWSLAIAETRPVSNFLNDVSTWLASYYCRAKRANARTDSALSVISTTTIIAFSLGIMVLATNSINAWRPWSREKPTERYSKTVRKRQHTHLDDNEESGGRGKTAFK